MINRITVHGAGVAGLATALALQDRGVPITIVERGKPRPSNALEVVGEEFFALVDAAGVPDLFGELGRPPPIDAIATRWPSNAGLEWAAGLRPTEQRWAIDRSEVEATLRRSAVVRGISIVPVGDRLQLRDIGDLIVDATGRAAAVARRMGVRLLPISDLIAISGYGRMDQSATPTVEAGPDGWWFAVGEARHSVVSYFTDAAEAARIRSPDDLGALLASTELLSRRFMLDRSVTPTRFSAASSYLELGAGAGWAAVGDALLARDPLASHGLTFAFQSALRLADACATGAFLPDVYLQPTNIEIARYRIGRQRLYLAGAEAFDRPFWHMRASLAGPAAPTAMKTVLADGE